jgi:hypothetical protein
MQWSCSDFNACLVYRLLSEERAASEKQAEKSNAQFHRERLVLCVDAKQHL